MFEDKDPLGFQTCPGCGNKFNQCTCEPNDIEDEFLEDEDLESDF